jgi:hypothetical protein
MYSSGTDFLSALMAASECSLAVWERRFGLDVAIDRMVAESLTTIQLASALRSVSSRSFLKNRDIWRRALLDLGQEHDVTAPQILEIYSRLVQHAKDFSSTSNGRKPCTVLSFRPRQLQQV